MDAGAWDERYAATPLLWGAEANRWLVAEAAELAPGRALDLAAGEGRNAVWLAARGWTVTAVDFSATALDKGRRRAEALDVAVEWVRADLLAWTPPPLAFDLVVVAYLQLPLAQRRRVHRAAAAAVAEGGALLVVAHDITNLTDGVGGPSGPRCCSARRTSSPTSPRRRSCTWSARSASAALWRPRTGWWRRSTCWCGRRGGRGAGAGPW